MRPVDCCASHCSPLLASALHSMPFLIQGLSNPNEMSTRQYNEYSGAAIGGTLILFVLPGSLLFDVSGFFKDFAFAAIIGGGIAAYLSLRKDAAGDAANKFGATLLDTVDKLSDKL